MTWLENILGKGVVRFRWWIIISTLLIVAVAASGIRFFTFSNDSRIYFSPENPQLMALEALENTFSKDVNVMFLFAPRDGEIFSRSSLQALAELTEAAWQIPYSSRVDSLTNFQQSRAVGDDLLVENLVSNPEDLSAEELTRLRKTALAEPMLVNRLISPQGDVAGLNILITKPDQAVDETDAIVAYARQLRDDFRQKYPAIDIYLTGGVVIDNAFGEASRDDITTLIPIMYLVLLAIMAILLRSLAGTIATLLVIVFAVLTGMGAGGWLGIVLSPASANAPTIILTLAVADSIHLLTTMFRLMGQGKSKSAAVTEALRLNLQPVFLTSVTTAIGFLTMNFSDAPPFHDLGNIVAVGIMAALVYSILFLPALIMVLPVRVKAITSSETHCPLCDWLAEFVIRHRSTIFRGMILLIAVLTLGIFRIELNDNFIHYFDERYDFRRATDFAEDRLTGFNVIEYALNSGEPGGINDPEFMAKVDAFAEWYRTQSKVVHVYSFTDTMKRLNKNMHGDNPVYYRLPERRDLAAQYLLLYEMSLPFGLDLNHVINVDRSAVRMVARIRGATTRELRDLDTKAREWFKANTPEMFTYGTGMSIVFAHISERNIKSMLGASFAALGLISLLLIIALRSVKFGLLSLIPNLAPAFMAFGAWGLLVGQVGLVISVLAALTLGIVVDDTIHFMNKYLRARRDHGLDPEAAVRYAFHTVGTAIWVTSLILASGFLVLAFSGFEINSDMGLMTAITIIFALILDFFFLPVLLMRAEGYK